jgi:hypothetical protein
MAPRTRNLLLLIAVFLAFVTAVPQDTASVEEAPSDQYADPSFLAAALNQTIGDDDVQADPQKRGAGSGCRCVRLLQRAKLA